MVRRFANQVHQQVSRLMRADFIQKEPVWYQAVLQYPPVPLPARAPPSRTEYDNRIPKPPYAPGQRTNLKRIRNKPLPIQYLEDDLRRQFFRDHPFEAFRPRTLVEGMGVEPPHSISGEAWTRLRQRGRNPTPEEYVPFHISCHYLISFFGIQCNSICSKPIPISRPFPIRSVPSCSCPIPCTSL